MKLSQEELADRVYVTRQTISNWENGKSYPDIQSLLLLRDLFGISLDQLIQGDVEDMKEEIKEADLKKYNRCASIFSVLLIVTIISFVPMAKFFKWAGLGASVILFVITFIFALKLEKYKKMYDIYTWKEIAAFTEGKQLSHIEKAQEAAKRPYQKILLALGSGLISALVAMFFWGVLS